MTGGGARPRSSIDCCPLLAPEPERLTAADGVGQGSVIPSHDPSRISRLRPVWRKLRSLRGKGDHNDRCDGFRVGEDKAKFFPQKIFYRAIQLDLATT